MSSVVISGDTSGAITLQAPAVAGNTTLTLPTTSGTVVVANGAQTIEFADGSASAPSITNSGDTNTGIFFPLADTIAFAEGGNESMRIDASGNVSVGVQTANARLEIAKTSGVAFRLNDLSTNYWELRNDTNLIFDRGGTERMRIDANGQNTMTTTIGYAQLRNVNSVAVASGGTVDFPSMSGILIVNNWSQGSVVIFSCGGGLVSTVNTNGLYGGSVAYVAGINGYRWTSNSPAATTHTYSFTLIATRPAA